MLNWGDNLFQQVPSTSDSPTQTLHINGAIFRLASGSSDLTVPQLLEREAEACTGSVPTEDNGPLAERALSMEPATGQALRHLEAGRGFVACLTPHDTSDTSRDQEGESRLARFFLSMDLNELGRLRYVFAKQTDSGTHYFAIRLEGELKLDRMFPDQGDAPGRDLTGVPRPRGSRRVVSVFQQDRREAFVVYQAQESPRQLSEFYRQQLRKRGWTTLQDSEGESLTMERDDELIAVVIDEEHPGQPWVTITSM
jgi:hypothetical protein